MAYNEYLDLYFKAQKNEKAPYYVVSFDTVNSKNISPDDRKSLQNNIFVITKYVYSKLLEKEKETGKKIIIDDESFFRPWDIKEDANGNFMDPVIYGDSFQFTVLRDTISKEEIISLVNECSKTLDIKEEFHISDGYYETNEYSDGNKKLFRGYLLQILANLHKEEIQNEFKRSSYEKNRR